MLQRIFPIPNRASSSGLHLLRFYTHWNNDPQFAGQKSRKSADLPNHPSPASVLFFSGVIRTRPSTFPRVLFSIHPHSDADIVSSINPGWFLRKNVFQTHGNCQSSRNNSSRFPNPIGETESDSECKVEKKQAAFQREAGKP